MPGPLERAIEHHRRGELAEAEGLYRRILKVRPDAPDALHLLGCLELQRDRKDRAIRLIQKAVDRAPGVALYHENLAEAYHRRGDPDGARIECRLALRLDRNSVRSLNRLGVLALDAGDLEAARDLFRQALEIVPGYAEALVNLSAVHTRLGEFSPAEETAELALKLEPGNRLAWNNLGLARKARGDRAGSREAFLNAGDLPRARYNVGYLHMLEDEPEAGLPLLELRRSALALGKGLKKPEWDGKDRPGKRLLILHEQGMGDTLLMSRFFVPLLERFAAVTVLVQPPLERLLATLDPRLRIVTGLEGAPFDCWIPAMSLPFRMGIRRIAEVPVEPWILPGRRPGGGGPRIRAGINWAGNPAFQFDRLRSTTLDTVGPLLEIPGISWVSVHKGHCEGEAERSGLPSILGEARDFLDTAEALAGLDVVVSTETAVPNLSAAMGIPTLVLAAVDHDWRWGSWYRDATVCAQTEPGDWTGAVRAAAGVLKEMRQAEAA